MSVSLAGPGPGCGLTLGACRLALPAQRACLPFPAAGQPSPLGSASGMRSLEHRPEAAGLPQLLTASWALTTALLAAQSVGIFPPGGSRVCVLRPFVVVGCALCVWGCQPSVPSSEGAPGLGSRPAPRAGPIHVVLTRPLGATATGLDWGLLPEWTQETTVASTTPLSTSLVRGPRDGRQCPGRT